VGCSWAETLASRRPATAGGPSTHPARVAERSPSVRPGEALSTLLGPEGTTRGCCFGARRDLAAHTGSVPGAGRGRVAGGRRGGRGLVVG
jgi:hypothetical protein